MIIFADTEEVFKINPEKMKSSKEKQINKFTGKEYDAYIEALSTSKDNDDVKDDQSNKKKAIE